MHVPKVSGESVKQTWDSLNSNPQLKEELSSNCEMNLSSLKVARRPNNFKLIYRVQCMPQSFYSLCPQQLLFMSTFVYRCYFVPVLLLILLILLLRRLSAWCASFFRIYINSRLFLPLPWVPWAPNLLHIESHDLYGPKLLLYFAHPLYPAYKKIQSYSLL